MNQPSHTSKRPYIQAKEEGFFEMFFLDLSFGMRRGELLALRWDDINPDREEIRISGQVTRVNGKLTYSAPKTISSMRTIRMTKIAAHVLKEYQKTAVSEWLFPSPHNPEVTRDPAACRKRLTGILEHAGCRHVRFHDLRHTFATMAIQNQIDIKTVSDILGHSTVETTINTYLHVTEQMRRSAADSIDRKIAGAVPAYEPEETAPADGRSASQNAAAAKFEPYRGKIRKRGTGYVKQLTQSVVGCETIGKNTVGLVDTGDVHCMMIGAAGVGKTAYWLYPNIEYACASGMSFLSTDTKGVRPDRVQ